MANDLNNIETFIKAARRNGTNSDRVADEIIDLQDMLRVAWNLMTEEQRANFAMSDAPLDVIQQGFPHWSEDTLPTPGR